MSNFAQNLSRIRKQQGLTQQFLAEQLNLTFQAISKWETAQSLPDLKQLTRLADLLHVSTDTLLGHTPRTASGQYQQRYNQAAYYWGLAPSSMCYEVMKLLPPTRPMRVLDIGCGEGKDAVFMARCGYAVSAFDIAQSGIDKLRRLADNAGVFVDAFRADVNDYRPDAEYDIVFSSGVLHYIRPELRSELFSAYQARTAVDGVHAMNVFVQKPFIAPPPEIETSYDWHTGELFSLYRDWKMERCEEIIFDCDSSGVPHQHCMDVMIARKI